MQCPACSHENPSSQKFCGECGAALAEAQPKAEPSSGSPRVSEPAGERKQVTVLFSDLSGYTAMTEKLDAEEVREVMGQVFGEASQVISRYGGVIEKYIGDAVMAVFGLNQAHEDDAVRAVRAAQEIHRAAEALNPRLRERLGREVAMHTGINTGLVVTGRTGEAEGAMGVVGDAVNVASRLSGLAKAGEILTGAETAALAGRNFILEEMEPTEVKGKAEAVRVFRVVETRQRPIATRRFAGLRASLIGRTVELAQLQESAQRLRDGKGSILALRAEAGTGKSRLLEEFRLWLPETFQWLSGNAYDHTRDIPYAPVVDMLAGGWAIREGDTPAQVREKLEAGAREVLAEPDAHVPYLGALFSLEYPEAARVSPEYRKDKIRDALLALFEGMARKRPTIFHLEDMHWADPSTVELLRHVLTHFRQPAITVCSYRPPFHLFLENNVPGYRELEIEALSPTLAEDMTGALLKGAEPPKELVKFVKDRAGGNPFFIEEMVTSLMETGALVRDNGAWKLAGRLEDSDVPGTVQGVIASRLDRLEPENKRLLQEASVIGRSFFYEVLGRITALSGDLRQRLDGLESQDMVRAQALEPDLEYMFKHPLIQEVVYGSLLHKDRQAIHERVGRAIEEVLTERLPEYYERLAHHFLNGESREKAVKYLMHAGEKAMDRFALEEAKEAFQKAYDLLLAAPSTDEWTTQRLFQLLDRWGLLHYYLGTFAAAELQFLKHREQARNLLDSREKGMFFGWLGWAQFFILKENSSIESLEESERIGERIKDDLVRAHALTWLAYTVAALEDAQKGLDIATEAHELAQTVSGHHYLYSKSLSAIGFAYFVSGHVERLLPVADRLIEYGRTNSHSRSQALGYWLRSLAYQNAGDFSLASTAGKEGTYIAKDPFHGLLVKAGEGVADAMSGTDSGVLEAVVEELQTNGCTMLVSWFAPFVGVGKIQQGEMKAGMAMIDEAIKKSLKLNSESVANLGRLCRGIAFSQFVSGKPPPLMVLLKNTGFLLRNLPVAARRAEADLSAVQAFYHECHKPGIAALASLHLGFLHKAKKRKEKARQCLAEAETTFKDVGAYVYLEQAQEALAQLEGK